MVPIMLEFIIPIAHAAGEAANTEAQTGILNTFGVSWKFFIAQLFNFSIVVFICWKWVLTPVAKKLSERTAKINLALKDAEDIQAEKKEFDEWKQEELAKARAEAREILDKAEKQSQEEKKVLLDQTKQEQKKMVAKAKAQIEQDGRLMLENLKGSVADLVTTATEKVLSQKLDNKHDRELIEKTVRELTLPK